MLTLKQTFYHWMFNDVFTGINLGGEKKEEAKSNFTRKTLI